MSKQLVLVTGGSGFLGAWCIVKLLQAGYRVRTTVRSLKRDPDVRAMVKQGGAEPGRDLEVVAANLLSDAGWPEAVAGCEFVLHVASPFPLNAPKHEDEVVSSASGAKQQMQNRRVSLFVLGPP
jgi:dihydroflavonol-4-reductase